MDFNELVQAIQTLNTEDAFRARLKAEEWRTIGPYLTQEDRNFKRCFPGPWPGCVGHLGLAGQCSE